MAPSEFSHAHPAHSTAGINKPLEKRKYNFSLKSSIWGAQRIERINEYKLCCCCCVRPARKLLHETRDSGNEHPETFETRQTKTIIQMTSAPFLKVYSETPFVRLAHTLSVLQLFLCLITLETLVLCCCSRAAKKPGALEKKSS